MEVFLKKLMFAAQTAGLEAYEASVVERDSFSATVREGEVVEYKSNNTHGLGFRGLKNGRMGYASTEAFDDCAIAQLVQGVLESAELSEDSDTEFIYHGKDILPDISLCQGLAEISAEEKIACALTMEKAVKEYDTRIENTAHNNVHIGRYTVRILNSYGMDRTYTQDMCAVFTQAKACDGDAVSSGYYGKITRDFKQLDPVAIGQETAKRAVSMLHAASVPTGQYRVAIHAEAMTDLLSTFCGIFSAENAQKGLSLLKGKIGEQVSAACLTLVDDPLLADGAASRPFDDEGVPSSKHVLVGEGKFLTFLYNLKTAHRDGVQTTGNAAKAGYASAIHVAPSNLYIAAGTTTFEVLLKNIGSGLLITDVTGLHAGANPVSGDFSLLSKGYVIEDGKIGRPVAQITMAGNFYELLKQVRDVANDLVFPSGAFGSPSLDVGFLPISGK